MAHPQAMTWVEGIMPQVNDPALIMNWAKLLLQKGRMSQAEQLLLERTRQAGNDPAPWLLLGAIRQEMKNASGATEAWLQFLKESASNPKLTRERDQALLGLAQLGIEAKREAEAEKWLTQVTDPDNLLRARLMRATILGRKGQIEQGRALIATLPAQTQKQEIARTMTEVQYLRQFKQWQATYDLLAQTARQFDDENEVAYELALAAEKVGKVDEMEAIQIGRAHV